MSGWALPTNTWRCDLRSKLKSSFFRSPTNMLIGQPIPVIRKILHQKPELSREESQTAKNIADYFSNLTNFQIEGPFGYHSFVAVRKFGEGLVIAFRAELDALPIKEISSLSHKSRNPGKSHVCGHDGHMSIALALANELEQNPPSGGTVCFIFQSAEETGEGAEEMIKSEKFRNLGIDFCYALHNIPGLQKGTVHSRIGSFACASVGVTASIEGKTSHAAHPENAINPLEVAIGLWSGIGALPQNEVIDDFALATSIALHSGERTFGTSPASAELLVTMRAARTEHLDFMMEQCKAIANSLAKESAAKIELSFQEYFPATENADLIENLKEACTAAEVQFYELKLPFRWSEDFAHFSKCFPTLMFGLGSGIEQPALHAPNFDFPDEIIEPGKSVFYQLYKIHNPS